MKGRRRKGVKRDVGGGSIKGEEGEGDGKDE